MKIAWQILMIIVWTSPLAGQTQYEVACEALKRVSFYDEFNYDVIASKSVELFTLMDSITENELKECNCADTLWIASLKDRRNFISYRHSVEIDTSTYLRMLSSKLDVANLKQEFRLREFKTLQDSFNYVLTRMKEKEDKRNTPKYNWQNFYHCIEAESYFLKNHRYDLTESYFKIFDDTINSPELRSQMLYAYFNSNESIEEAILSRIESYVAHRVFYLMLGVLGTSGTEKSIDFLIQMMRKNNFELNKQKVILQAIYGITDREKISKSVTKRLKNYLEETELDKLTRYDLFIRD